MRAPANERRSLGRATYYSILLLILAAGAALRVWHIEEQSLWFDEARFLEAALRPDFQSLVRFMIREDYHPPLYPLVLKGWVTLFGTSDASVRALPAIVGLTLVPLTAWLTTLMTRDRRASLAAAALVSIGGYHLYLSQEARHYTWLAALGLLNIVAYVQVLRYSRKRWLATLGVTAVIGSLSHYYMLLLAVGEIVFAARARVRLRGTVLAVLAATVIAFVLLWAGPFMQQGKQRSAWGQSLIDPLSGPWQALTFVGQSIYWTAVDFSLGRPILLLGGRGFDWPDLLKIAFVGVTAGLGILGLVRLGHRPSGLPFSPLGMLAAVGGLPVALAVASSLTEAMIYDTKYVSFAAPLWAVAVGVGFTTITTRPVAALLGALVFVGLGASALEFHLEAIPWKEDWRGAANVIRSGWADGDVVLQRASYTSFCLDHYLGWEPERLAAPGTLRAPRESLRPILAELRRLRARRLWVVNSHDEEGARLRELLAERLEPGPVWPLPGITMALYRVEPQSDKSPDGSAAAIADPGPESD